MNRLPAGLIAGAVGTLALDAATYVDMAVRGRAASDVPADTVEHNARRFGIGRLIGDGAARNRREGIGAISGHSVGLAIGAGYALLRPQRRYPLVAEGLVVGALAMVPGNAGAVSSGTTDPRRWTMAEWMADLVPHLVFGLVAVAIHRAIRPERHA